VSETSEIRRQLRMTGLGAGLTNAEKLKAYRADAAARGLCYMCRGSTEHNAGRHKRVSSLP